MRGLIAILLVGTGEKYQHSGAGGTRSPPATPNRLPVGPKMADGVLKGVQWFVLPPPPLYKWDPPLNDFDNFICHTSFYWISVYFPISVKNLNKELLISASTLSLEWISLNGIESIAFYDFIFSKVHTIRNIRLELSWTKPNYSDFSRRFHIGGFKVTYASKLEVFMVFQNCVTM